MADTPKAPESPAAPPPGGLADLSPLPCPLLDITETGIDSLAKEMRDG